MVYGCKQASKQASTFISHFCNGVPLVWGSLRFVPIMVSAKYTKKLARQWSMNKKSRPPAVNVRLTTTTIYENSTVQLASVGLAQARFNYLGVLCASHNYHRSGNFHIKKKLREKNFQCKKFYGFVPSVKFFNGWQEFTLPMWISIQVSPHSFSSLNSPLPHVHIMYSLELTPPFLSIRFS